MSTIAFIDTETDQTGRRLLDVGGIRSDGNTFHACVLSDFVEFLRGSEYVCGHNILDHDLKYLDAQILEAGVKPGNVIDTLYLSPLLFPKKPYHSLLKNDKLQTDELNNPLNDSIKARDLFNDELSAFMKLDEDMKKIYFRLLGYN